MWTPPIETAIAGWQSTGVFPFPSLQLYPAPMPHLYTAGELRLMYYAANLYHQQTAIDNSCADWARHIPTLVKLDITNGNQLIRFPSIFEISATSPYVMHALLAFAAMHIGIFTSCRLVGKMVLEYRQSALIGLRNAIETFSRETSDAILGASIVLSWQATDL